MRIREENHLTQQQLADKLNISREMVVKMESGSRPVSKSTQILLDKFTSDLKSEKSTNTKSNIQSQMENSAEKLIKSLEDRIAEYRERILELKGNIEDMRSHNHALQNFVQASLQNVLKNQVVLEAAMEARQDKILELLAKDEADFDKIFDSVYKSEVQKLKEYDGTDNRLQIGKVYKK